MAPELPEVQELLTAAGADALVATVEHTVDDLPVFGLPVPLRQAASLWQNLRDRHPETGLWPFLSHFSPADWAKWCADAPGGQQRLTNAMKRPGLDVIDELIAAHRASVHEYQPPLSDELADYKLELFDVGETPRLLESEPQARPWDKHGEIAGQGRDLSLWWLCLTPAQAAFEVPALLYAPLANDWMASAVHPELTAEDHVAVLRSWQERFGAEIRYLDPVGLGLVVTNPPTDPPEVARVAVEQYAYCDDLDQFIGEPWLIAQQQVPAANWYFWWD
jgi:hypothetical protein